MMMSWHSNIDKIGNRSAVAVCISKQTVYTPPRPQAIRNQVSGAAAERAESGEGVDME